MSKNLTELTARTDTANSDLIHVNSGGSDYKQTKQNFLLGEFKHTFATNEDLTTQVDALQTAGTYFGSCAAYNHKDEVNVPINTSMLVCARVFNSQFAEIEIHVVGQGDARYTKAKNNGSWETSWTKLATRKEQDHVSEIYTDPSVETGGTSKTFSISNSTRALVIIGGSAAERTGVWYIYCGGSGAMYIIPLVKSSNSKVDITSSANNRFTASTSASNAIAVDLVQFTSGTIAEVN